MSASPTTNAIAALVLGSVAGCMLACGNSGEDVGPDAGPNLERIWKHLEDCDLVGSFRVDATEASSCGEWPSSGETMSIELVGSEPVLRAGLLELPILAESAECTFVAQGCQAWSTDATERYLAPTFVVRKRSEGLALEASAVDVERGYVGPCADASFSAQRVAACDPVGSYQAEQAASIAEGSCDLEWSEGTVSIAPGADGYDLAWGGTEIRGLQLDESTCSLSGTRGVTDFWLYNNAMRSVEIHLSIDEEGLHGTALDQLDQETFDGKSCAGATFSLRAERPSSREATRFAASCDVAKPISCGDGVCEEGESCACAADCGCQNTFECSPDGTCRAPCSIASEASDCADGERCSPVGEFAHPTRILSSDTLYCDLEGPLGTGEVCVATTDCAAGLVCHFSARSTIALCAPPCGEGFATCSGDEVCGMQGDGSGSGWYPSAIQGCEHRAKIAEDCSVNACDTGLTCLSECINGVCEEYCTHSCSGGCPAELPVCGAIGVCTRS